MKKITKEKMDELKTLAKKLTENYRLHRQGVGLGDVVATITSSVGIKPCGGCKRRQEWLNKIQIR